MTQVKKHNLNALLFIIIMALLFFSNQIRQDLKKPLLNISKEESSYTIDKTFLKLFSLGNKRLVSSYLWVYTLLESDNEHYNKKDSNSWMFIRHNTIAEIDPLFYENYLYGGIYLSIVKDDVSGAAIIYEKGLVEYPNDYNLLLNTAFNYYFEMNELEKGYEKFRILKDHPDTLEKHPFLISLIARIGSKLGKLEDSYQMLLFLDKSTHGQILKDQYKKSLYAVRAEIDLNCLNNNGENCLRKDFFGLPYIYRDGKFKAQKEWKKFRPFNKKK